MLDRGITYTKGGIIFFILSILFLQMLSASNGFQVQYIYGIVSCSLLFIFIEFLSAWFLTQYRHFVDTSTYLLKVKAIFDRYYLTYLVTKEYGNDKTGAKLFAILHEDINWPDKMQAGKHDIGFAREAIEAMAALAKAYKVKAKDKDDEK